MTQTIWTAPAQADLAEIDDHYAERDAAFAERVGRAVLQAGRFPAQFPLAGPAFDGDHRRWRAARSPYLPIHRPVNGNIEILREWHERRRWPSE